MSDDTEKTENSPSREQKIEFARAFYEDSKRADDNRSAEEQASSIDSQLNGINFNREVEIEAFKRGDIFGQVREQSLNHGEHPIGNYFFKPGAEVDKIGVAGDSKEGMDRSTPDFFQATRDGEMLKSTASDIESFYRDGRSGELLYGGETQYYTTDREAFSRVIDSSRVDVAGEADSSQPMDGSETEIAVSGSVAQEAAPQPEVQDQVSFSDGTGS